MTDAVRIAALATNIRAYNRDLADAEALVRQLTAMRDNAVAELSMLQPSVANTPMGVGATDQAQAGAVAELEPAPPAAAEVEGATLGNVEQMGKTGPTRVELDSVLAALPGDHDDADYVVTSMRRHFGEVFTDADEAAVRAKVPAKVQPPAVPPGSPVSETAPVAPPAT